MLEITFLRQGRSSGDDEGVHDELVTSVRAVVLVGAQVLVVHDPHAIHILPGGRREPGETLLTTLRREVLEETGWEKSAKRKAQSAERSVSTAAIARTLCALRSNA